MNDARIEAAETAVVSMSTADMDRFARHHSAVPDVSPLWGLRWGA